MTCPACGAANRPGRKFCSQCGAGLDRTCPACGAANEAGARFCGDCGATIEGSAVEPAPDAIPAGPAPDPSSVQVAERRLVSVLFADLVGFTTLAEDRDPETVRDLLSRYFETTRDVVERHGGVVEKFIGDAVMAVWGTPTAHEDDAERSVRAALEIVDAVRGLETGVELRARAGVLTGDAAVTVGAQNQGMVAGDLVNTAARLQGVAEPGTVLVGEATMHAASNAVVFEAVGEHALKGKVTPVPAWRALRVVAARGGQGRADGLEPPFVGRDEESRHLKELLHATARDPRLRLVSVTGPPGIGKHRLVWELEKYVDGVTEDIYWHRGRSPSYGEGITFWALGEMVRRRAGLVEDDDDDTTRARIAATVTEYVADTTERAEIERGLLALLGLEPAPAAGREALFPSWRAFFEAVAQRGTTVLVFEDLHWADSGLLDFVDHLLEWSRALPIMVVTLARPELFERRPDWGSGRRNFTAIALEPLTEAAMRELLDGLVPGLPAAAVDGIVARAEGVPLYAVEMVRALLADARIERDGDRYRPTGDLTDLRVPESLRSLIASRLDALEPADRGLLQDASVLGQAFSAESLAAVSGEPAAELEPRLRTFVRRELLVIETDPRSPERGQYKFVQSLLREVAYGTLGRRDRRARHLAVARHYEAIGDEELAGALATHYLAAHAASEAGDEADAIAGQARLALKAAAARAMSLGAPQQATAYLDRALGVATDPRERAEILALAGAAATAAGLPAAETYARHAVEAARALDDLRSVGSAQALLGRVLLDATEIEPALEMLEGAAAELAEAGDPAAESAVLAMLSRAYMRATKIDESIETADRALRLSEPLDLDAVTAEALVNKASSLSFHGRRHEAAALMTHAIALAHQTGQLSLELRARHNHAISEIEHAPRGVAAQLRIAVDLARRIGDRSMLNWVAGTLSWISYLIGSDWDEASAMMREGLEASELPGDRIRMLGVLAAISAARGEGIDETVADLERTLGDSPVAEELQWSEITRAHAALARGNLAEAYRLGFDGARQPAQAADHAARLAIRAATWRGDLAGIAPAFQAGQALMAPSPFNTSLTLMVDGTTAVLEDRPDEGRPLLRDGIAILREMGIDFELACAIIDAIELLPDDPEVRSWAPEAHAILARTRARPYLERLDSLVPPTDAAGPSPAPSAPATPPAEVTAE